MAEPITGLTRRDLLRLGVATGPAALLAAMIAGGRGAK